VAPELKVTVLNRQRGRRVARSGLESFLERVAVLVPPERPGELSVSLVSDRRMREFNRRFRGKDPATDVLSFPSGEGAAPDGSVHFGDIAIAVPTAARQARERGHTLARELKLLMLHGYLHLLGHDHEQDRGQMMQLQRRVERKLLATPSGDTAKGRRS